MRFVASVFTVDVLSQESYHDLNGHLAEASNRGWRLCSTESVLQNEGKTWVFLMFWEVPDEPPAAAAGTVSGAPVRRRRAGSRTPPDPAGGPGPEQR